MQDVILLVSTSAIFIFGYFLMRKLDVFLENNRNRQETALTYGENSLRIGFPTHSWQAVSQMLSRLTESSIRMSLSIFSAEKKVNCAEN